MTAHLVPDITSYFDTATNTWTYLVADPVTGEAAIIDAVLGELAA
jgi:hypothetical protein